MQKISFAFWQGWSSTHRLIFFALALTLAVTLAAMWWTYAETPSPAIALQTIQEAHLVEIPVHRFESGIFDLSIAGNNYIIYERLLGAPLEVPAAAGYFFAIVLFAAFSVLLAVFTTLSRFYYLVCMGLVIVFIVSLRLETIVLFGMTDKTMTVAVLASYVLASFYFYSFAKGINFTQRLGFFSLISIAFLSVVYFFGRVELPVMQLAANAMAAGIVVSIIFIVLVAHEIVVSFITIVTQGAKPSKSLNHFLIISLIYLVNLALAYAVRYRYISWDLVTIDLFLLLTISGILGVWGIRQRQKQYEGVLDVEPYGVMALTAMGSICFALLAWFFASANDPGLEAFSDLIIYTHLSYGLIFVLYIISNFGGMLSNNLAVHKVLYNPNNMPYFTFRLGGLIATAAFVIFNNWQVPFQNLFASYFNAAGDHSLEALTPELAKVYYERSANLGFANHHSNYALGNIEGARLNTANERTHYERASYSHPTAMSVLNLSQTFQTEGFDLLALFRLKDGLTAMPDNGAIQNSIGYLFLKSGVTDSAQFYFQQAAGNDQRILGETNLMALRAQLRQRIDSGGTQNNELLSHHSYRSNLVARQNFHQEINALPLTVPTDTVLDRSTTAWLNNKLINNPQQADTTLLKQLTELAQRPSNRNLREPLLFAIALTYYKKGEVQLAYRLLEDVTISSAAQGKYNNILALWTLEQNEPARALGYLDFALQQNYEPARLTHAVLLAEAGRVPESLAAWDSVQLKKDSITSLLANRIKSLLTVPVRQAFLLSDEDKAAFCHYRATEIDSTLFTELVSTIANPDRKAKALLERSERLFRFGRVSQSVQVFQQIRGMELGDKKLFDRIRAHETMLLASRGELNTLEEMLNNNIALPAKNRIYAQALLANSKGDTAAATPLFVWLSKSNLFFEEGVIAAAAYFRERDPNSFLPYTILVDAIQSHPAGIKLRMAYSLEAARRGFADFAASSIDELRNVLNPVEISTLEEQIRLLSQQPENE